MSKSVQKQMNKLLDDYYQLVRDEYEGGAKDVADECVKRLKAVTFKTNLKGYSRNWTVTKERWGAYTVHNKKTYRLTHLLENSHIIANKKGEYGRTSEGHGQVVHIEPVYEWAKSEIEREIRQRIERGKGGVYG